MSWLARRAGVTRAQRLPKQGGGWALGAAGRGGQGKAGGTGRSQAYLQNVRVSDLSQWLTAAENELTIAISERDTALKDVDRLQATVAMLKTDLTSAVYEKRRLAALFTDDELRKAERRAEKRAMKKNKKDDKKKKKNNKKDKTQSKGTVEGKKEGNEKKEKKEKKGGKERKQEPSPTRTPRPSTPPPRPPSTPPPRPPSTPPPRPSKAPPPTKAPAYS